MTDLKNNQEINGIPLNITESDLDVRVISEIKAKSVGDQVLGDGFDELSDAIPAAVLKKIKRLFSLKDYAIVDVTLKFNLGGELLGIKVGGDVSVKLSPKQ